MSTGKEPAGHHVAACAAPPLISGRGNLPSGGWHARKFASSQVTLMIRKEGTSHPRSYGAFHACRTPAIR
jgi:hypothetical protein